MQGMLAVGGIGGSGTRVVADLLQGMGFYLGSDLNGSKDNLWFTLLFKRPEVLRTTEYEFQELVKVFRDAMHSVPISAPKQIALVHSLSETAREQHALEWLRKRAESLLGIVDGPCNRLIGWKEPNTHILLDRLASHMPKLHYIHIMRNGLDMAFSGNQNQTRLWGPVITGKPFDPSPSYSLNYWCKAQQRVLQIGRRMGRRFHLVNFHELCSNPFEVIHDILIFAGVQIDEELQDELRLQVIPPTSIGRFRMQDLTVFDPEDVAFVASCGFPTA